jgi:hypothetical protein
VRIDAQAAGTGTLILAQIDGGTLTPLQTWAITVTGGATRSMSVRSIRSIRRSALPAGCRAHLWACIIARAVHLSDRSRV